ncbi:MAG TPA: PEP-CTERM sorting domain-containing protein [Candidatus Hydrogenedentes bacterium]|nr:PEP-CTERM sorting domain-containing protein [Candidatus Hydrogenedentota bacterium]
MKKAAILVVAALLASAPGWATSFDGLGKNITVFDGQGSPGEDNEVEPGCAPGQQWDLEGFFLTKDNVLQLVGGYSFAGGFKYEGKQIKPGDLFIDIDGLFGSTSYGSNMGYEYAVSWVFGQTKSTPADSVVYKLTTRTKLSPVSYKTPESDPWKIKPGEFSNLSIVHSGMDSVSYTTGVNELAGLNSFWETQGTHNIVEFDLNWLWDELGTGWSGLFNVRYTYENGFDVVVGQSALVRPGSTPDPDPVVPEPATLTLVGLGITAAAASRLRKS